MNKLLVGTLLAFACVSSYSDDLKVADDFKSGDLVSADTFNQIFDTLEQINRTVVDTDLVGVWSCKVSEHSANTASTVSGWSQKGLIWELTEAQINMTASSGSTSKETAYTITTGAPSPLFTTSNGASTGTYVLFEGMMFVEIGDSTATHTYEVDIVSNDRITLKGNAELGPPQPTFLVCDSAEALPASPISPIAKNNKAGINLAWTDASSDETGFKVYRKLSTESEYKSIGSSLENFYDDTTLSDGQKAFYQIVSYNTVGESAKSKTVSATADYTTPNILAVTPVAEASLDTSDAITLPDGVYLNPVVSFSEPVAVALAYVELIDTSNNSVIDTIDFAYGGYGTTYNHVDLINTLSFYVKYESGKKYQVRIKKNSVKDAAGNFIEADYIWSFFMK